MRVNISSLLGNKGQSLKVERELRPDFLEQDAVIKQALSSLVVEAKLTNTGDGIYVQGTVRVELLLECTRCLQDFPFQIVTDFEDEFVRHQAGRRREREEDLLGDKTPTYSGDELDLSELIRESVLLAVPMKVVCSGNCQGLCSKCGQRLAEGKCDCDTRVVDPRLAPLADFFQDVREEEE